MTGRGLQPRGGDPAVEHEVRDPRTDQVRALAALLDSAFRVPGTQFRIGIDSIIGLIPGIGDLIGAGLSGWIILQASRLGAPRSVLLRMGANVAVDTLAGAIPGLGDLFDAAWKANAKNARLLQQHVERPAAARRSSRAFVALLLTALVLAVIGAFVLAAAIVRAIVRTLAG